MWLTMKLKQSHLVWIEAIIFSKNIAHINTQ